MRTIAPLLLALFVSGCVTHVCEVNNPYKGGNINGPAIETITVTGASQGAQGTVAAELRIPGFKNLRVHHVNMEYRSTAQENQPFIPAGEMEETSNNHYEGTLPLLNYGPYEVCVSAVLRPGPQLEPEPAPDLILVDHELFHVAPGTECFAFVGDDVQGWTFGGVFDQTSGDQIVAPGAAGFQVAVFGGGSGLLVLPNLPQSGSQGLWRFDYISPDLAGSAAWQAATEAVFRVSAAAPVSVQPMYTYVDAAGEEHVFAPVDSSGQFVFQEVNGTLEFTASTMDPGDMTLVRLRLRVFGDYTLTSTPEMWVNFHFVCPLLDR